jgi:hypothetical protein
MANINVSHKIITRALVISPIIAMPLPFNLPESLLMRTRLIMPKNIPIGPKAMLTNIGATPLSFGTWRVEDISGRPIKNPAMPLINLNNAASLTIRNIKATFKNMFIQLPISTYVNLPSLICSRFKLEIWPLHDILPEAGMKSRGIMAEFRPAALIGA